MLNKTLHAGDVLTESEMQEFLKQFGSQVLILDSNQTNFEISEDNNTIKIQY